MDISSAPARSSVIAQPATASAWRVRIRMDDRPGTLARIAVRLADLECNILGLAVLPVPGGVLDEIVLRPPDGLLRRHLLAAIRAEGGDCTAIADADVRELVDPATSVLSAARGAVEAPDRIAEVLCAALGADLVSRVPVTEANPGRTESGHRAVIPLDAATALVARRRWAPFVDLELTRASALIAVRAAAEHNVAGPVVLARPDGAAVVLRKGVPADADMLSALHNRCSAATLFRRYHTGVRTVPRRWLHRLLMPPRGTSVVAACGHEVIGFAQFIPIAATPAAEVSLLVEDSWQRRGIGTALLARVATLAVAAGITELRADRLPGDQALLRTAARAGLRPAATPGADGALRMFVDA